MNANAWNADADIEEDDWRPVATPSNYVPAQPVRRPDPPAALMTPPAPATIDAWRPQEALHEATDARDRAVGFTIRMIPLAAIWLALSLALALTVYLLAGGVFAAVAGLMLWGSLTALTWLLHDRQERMFAAGGIERHRLDLAHDLERRRIEHEAEARRAVIQAYLKRMEE